jgi:hypothetical protein
VSAATIDPEGDAEGLSPDQPVLELERLEVECSKLVDETGDRGVSVEALEALAVKHQIGCVGRGGSGRGGIRTERGLVSASALPPL